MLFCSFGLERHFTPGVLRCGALPRGPRPWPPRTSVFSTPKGTKGTPVQRFSQKPRRHCREPMPRSQVDRESRGRVMRVTPRGSHPGGVAGPREERGARLHLCSGLSQGMSRIRSAQAGGHPDQPSGLTVPALPVTGQGGRAPGGVGWPGSTHSPVPRGARSVVFPREVAASLCQAARARWHSARRGPSAWVVAVVARGGLVGRSLVACR